VRLVAGVIAFALVFTLGICRTAGAETLAHGRFKHVEIFRPPGEVKHFALLMSGDGGWSSRLARIAGALASEEATLVAGVDTSELFADLEKDGGSCVSPDGDLENLSHYVQAYYKVPTYFTPILIGHSAGATLAYSSLAQAPAGIFGGALTLSFCVDLDLRKPLCQAQGLRYKQLKYGARLLPAPQLHAPWVALHGTQDHVCPIAEARQFVSQINGARLVELPKVAHNYRGTDDWLPQFKTAFESIVATQVVQRLPAPPASLADLPIVEVEATPGTLTPGAADSFAVLLSGDGGWAGIDKEVAGLLADRGVPTAGVDSLRYFWTPRTPVGLAQDIDRIVRYYAFHWKKKYALLVGYSQGADVLPFALNRLPVATRSMVRLTTLIGIAESADFEFHVANWIGGDSGGLPVKPEIEKLSSADTLCVYGDDDDDSICPKVNAQHARVIKLPGGHHFGGNYVPLAQLVIGAGVQPH
jgi:type IV secretory pathway VirJ component